MTGRSDVLIILKKSYYVEATCRDLKDNVEKCAVFSTPRLASLVISQPGPSSCLISWGWQQSGCHTPHPCPVVTASSVAWGKSLYCTLTSE